MHVIECLRRINDRYNQATILALREELVKFGWKYRQTQDDAILAACRTNLVYIEMAEGPVSDAVRAAGIKTPCGLMVYVSLRF